MISNVTTISQKEARKIALHSQDLIDLPKNTLQSIQQLSYIQIDTISVTQRAHNHILFTRNQQFNPSELNQLMDKKVIFEYWSHAAAYLPIEDYRYSLYRKELYKSGDNHWFPRDKKVEKYVLDRITADGALQSKDFDAPAKSKEWYEWKPSKIALTNLFMDGSIMIGNRKGFQKIFDLTERILPKNINTSIPTIEEYCRHLILNAIKAHGLITLNEIAYLRKGTKPTLKKVLANMVESNEIETISIDNNKSLYYTSNQQLKVLNQKQVTVKQVHILNPFDNLIIQRKRVKDIFNFDYQIECYVPQKKRVFGYYTLPILYGNELVGRFDAKADRKTGEFIINRVWLEKGFKPSVQFKTAYNKQLKAFATFCGCKNIVGNTI
jgi:uncharacterized protein